MIVKSGPDPGIFKEGVDLVAVIYSLTNVLFSNKIIEPRLLEKRGCNSLNPHLDPGLRVLPCHSVISGLSLSTRTSISAVKMRDEQAPAPWVVADGNTIGSSVSDEMKKCDLL